MSGFGLLAGLAALLAGSSLDGAPAGFAVADRAVVRAVHGVGAQVYTCKPSEAGGLAWSFREPIATLIDGDDTVGRHYAGPKWTFDDGETVSGKMIAQAPGATPADIPQLKLDIVSHGGTGLLADARSVLRLRTRGGTLKGACDHAGDLRAVPYEADYLFLK